MAAMGAGDVLKSDNEGILSCKPAVSRKGLVKLYSRETWPSRIALQRA